MFKLNLKIYSLVFLCFFNIGCEDQVFEPGSYLIKGKAFFEQKEYAKAKLEIKNAIQESPKDSEAYYYLALINEKLKNYRVARENLISSVGFDANNLLAAKKLSKTYLLFNQLDEGLSQIEIVLKTESEDLDALSIKAAILFRQLKEDEALDIVEYILQKSSEHVDAISLKTTALLNKDKIEEALSVLLPALEKNNDVLALHVLKLKIDTYKKDLDEIIKDYKKLIELDDGNDNDEIRFTLAKIYLSKNQFDQAKQILNELIKNKPSFVLAKIELLDALYLIDIKQALLKVETLIAEDKSNFSLLISISNWLYKKDEVEKAKKVIKSIVNSKEIPNSDKNIATLLLAKIEVLKKDYNSALKSIDEVLKGDANNLGAKLLQAEVLIATDQYDDAKLKLEKILLNDPKLTRAMSLLGMINVIQGDLDKALFNYKNALELNPKDDIALKFLVGKATEDGHLDHAIEMLERSLNFLPNQSSIVFQLLDLNIIEENWDEVTKLIRRVEHASNGRILAKYFSAKSFQQKKEYETAIKIYDEVLQVLPNLEDALFYMADCYAELNQQRNMKKYLVGFVEKNPYVSMGYVLLSQMISADNKMTDSVKLMTIALDKKGINESSIYIELARVYILLDETQYAHKTYIKGISENPSDTNLKLLLASLLENTNDIDNAVKTYEEVLLLNPRHKIAKNNLATILVEKFSQQNILERAMELSVSFKQSKNPYFLDTYGWVLLQNGAFEDALATFKKVTILEPNIPVFRYHLAVAYSKLNDRFPAISELKQALYLGKGKQIPEKKLIENLLNQLKNQ